jgi:hypothetical protein
MNANPKSKTVKQAAAEILRREGRPLGISEIADHILRDEAVRLGGKTPKATISGQLYVEAKKPDGMFVKTGRAMIGLREQSPPPLLRSALPQRNEESRAIRESRGTKPGPPRPRGAV